MKSLAREDHPFSKFGTGNSETLKDDPAKGIVVRDSLLKFHAEFYSASVMTLCMYGVESLDDLQELAVTCFSGIKNTGISAPVFPGAPYAPASLGRELHVVPIKDSRSLDFCFPLPPILEHWSSKPVNYISHLLGHESAGSVIALLKAKNLGNDLFAGTARSCSDWSSFQISVDCTDEGLERTDEIADIVFSYINMLKKEGPKKWIFDETATVGANSFRFLSKSNPMDYACSLAGRMQTYPQEAVLTGAYLSTDYDPALIESMTALLSPDNMILSVTARKFKGETDRTEKWYGTEYTDVPLDGDTVKRWAGISLPEADLRLPEKNELIATDFDLKNAQSLRDVAAPPPAVPKLLVNDSLSRLWFHPDQKFSMPKCNVMTVLATPLAYSSPDTYCLSQLYATSLNELLNEFSYMASMAALSVSISSTRKGIEFTVAGFNHKLPKLMEKTMEFFTEFADLVDDALFARLKDKLLKQMRNFTFSPPYSHAGQASDLVLGPTLFSIDERIEAMEVLTVADLKDFSTKVLKRCNVEMLVHGNASETEARQFRTIVLDALKPLKLFESSEFGEWAIDRGQSEDDVVNNVNRGGTFDKRELVHLIESV